MKKKSVAFRLAVKFSLLVALIILFSSTLFVLFLNKSVYDRQCSELKETALQIAELLNRMQLRPPPPEKGKKPEFSSPIYPLQGFPLSASPDGSDNIPYYITFSVFKAEGESSEIANDSIVTNDPFLPRLPLTGGKVLRHYEKDFFIDGALNILYFAEEIQTKKWGAVVLQTALNMDQDSSRHFLSGIIRLAFFAFFPLVLLSFGIVYWITKRTMKPVKEITQASKKISGANLTERLPVSGTGDEIDTLAQTFNGLFLRLKKDFDREKQFTSDVSHELKTPLAVMLGHANLLRRWGKDDPVQLENSLSLLIGEIHSMESIVENLLQISRLDSGRTKLNFEKVDLSAVCNRLEQDTKVWATKTVFTIDESIKNCKIFSDEELFYQACTIVVSNSVKFFAGSKEAGFASSGDSSPQKNLCLMLSSAEQTFSAQQQIAFSISDNGPGIPPDVLPHVFERFYRGDPSHNRSVGGSGLGLSIVKSIMACLRGSVTAQSDGKTGTTIILTVPASE